MKSLFLLLTGLLIATCLPAQPISQKSDEYLSLANRAYHFNGVALVAQKGKILLHKAYGFSNVARRTTNDTATRFPILSITKSFTSTLILKLQEQGKLSVHDKLSDYAPDFPNGDSITVHHLLTHTSGLFDYMSLIDEEDSAIVCHPVAKQQILDILRNKPAAFKPGSAYAYCNSGYFMLGLIVEKITGKPYEQVVRELIFEPLGMNQSGFDYLHLPATIRAQGYDTLTADYQSPYPHFDSTVAYSAGSMYSTSGDMYKWGRAVARQKILTADSWKLAFTPHMNNYGYGWTVGKLQGRPFVRHDGGYPGFLSSFYYFPKDDVTLILLNNVSNYHNPMLTLVTALSAIVFDKPYNLWLPRTEIKVKESILQQYVGRYKVDPNLIPDRILSITLESGRLWIQANDEPKVELFAESNNHFFLKVNNELWTFPTDKKGLVGQVVIHVNGTDVVCIKINE